ncbi:2-isopropylmalate synthase [Aquabacterium sp.]|uniref:2-isopropylmalate synthase n=1 Tax=Aquabacterium sp. TaxID=1872578 RepID=UPI0035AEA61E
MLKHPHTKYPAIAPVSLPDRRWPSRVISAPPIWMSTDLRDGNQALFEPMDAERKMRLFKTLVAIGLKEIEVAFPSASQTDFDFTRTLIEGGHVPADVTIEVITQARESLIRRTFEALRGARRAIVHLYNATAPVWRRDVFGLTRDEVRRLAVSHIRLVRQLADEQPETEWVLQYSPETFSATELDFALDVCNAAVDEAGATPERPIIINLPSTVEVSTPNVYADQIEWMDRHLARRDAIVLSVHPHNDRGTAVAAAELAVMAGAQRVEGCLFGNGERTGNVDLVTLALNLYTQGVSPGLDFSNLNEVVRTVEHCNRLPVHPRHPYAGDLVYTAFSGSHQDAIRKGFAARQERGGEGAWEVPYLPIDPADLGRSYASVIRVNSQSGKGGVAYLLEAHYGVCLPRRMQIDFSQVVQSHTDASGEEASAEALWAWCRQAYQPQTRVQLVSHHLIDDGAMQRVELVLSVDGVTQRISGVGRGPMEAAVQALREGLGWPVDIVDYEEHAMQSGADAQAVALVETAWAGRLGSRFGMGVHANSLTAALQGVVFSAAGWMSLVEPVDAAG